MKIAVVTGASSGMGKEFALQIAKKYKTIEEIWVISRRKDKLEELESLITNKRVRVFPMDLTSEDVLLALKETLEAENPVIRVLVNAAGYGKIGYFDEISYEDNSGMIDINCTALVKLTYLALPYMNYPSNIINIASSAAFMAQPVFAVYAATKAFVLNFSRALNIELEKKGINVIAVCPGPVDTEFFQIAESEAEVKKYKKMLMVNAGDVVEKALVDANCGKETSIYGISMNAFRVITNTIPNNLIIKHIK